MATAYEKKQELYSKRIEHLNYFDLNALRSLLNQYKDDEDFQEYVLNSYIDSVCNFVVPYKPELFSDDVSVKAFLIMWWHISEEKRSPLYRALVHYLQGKQDEVLPEIKKSLPEIIGYNCGPFYDETCLAQDFLILFRNAFPGFWTGLGNILRAEKVPPKVSDICDIMENYYSAEEAEKTTGKLEQYVTKYPDSCYGKELLGIHYYNQQMWGNAAAFLEQVEKPYLIFEDEKWFMMGWCYGKLKEIRNEIEAYEKSYALAENEPFTLNNLGYAYYKAKQYSKALEAFRKCMASGLAKGYAENNFARTLLALKRYRDAKEFVKSCEDSHISINKALRERIAAADATNKRFKKDEDLDAVIASESKGNSFIGSNKETAKGQQFSSEKIMEDELTMRIQTGRKVFGKQLHIYREKGAYGRQYILPTGKRLDLLCEDDVGDLYIIELKKDSGYDDPYEQTADYLTWFEKNWKKKVGLHGIICVNDPTDDLVKKVHEDKRMQLFEYSIRYRER